METQSPTLASSEYKRRNAAAIAAGFKDYADEARQVAGLSDQELTEAMAAFFKTERCLITRAWYPAKVYQPCTDLLPRTMSWLAAGVPTDFMDRVTANLDRWENSTLIDLVDQAIERANLGEHGMAQVPDPCCCRIHAGTGNRCPDCPQHSGE